MLKDVKIQAEKESQYQEACSIVDSISFPSNKDVEEARNIFISLGDYKDSKDRLRHFKKVTLQEGNKGENSTYYYNAWGDVSLESIYSNTSYILRSTNDISDAHFSESNKIDPDWEMKFDENGNLIHDVIRRREYNYTYNSDGKVISCNNSFFWEYNDDGTLARCYDTTGTIERTYEYNSNGELIHLYWYREDVSITCYDEYYTYDDSGNLIEQRKQYRSNDGLGSGTDKTNYTYDEFGNLIKKVQYYGRGSNFAEEYTYEYSEDRVTITSTIVGKPHTKSTDYCYYIYGYIWVPNIALD